MKEKSNRPIPSPNRTYLRTRVVRRVALPLLLFALSLGTSRAAMQAIRLASGFTIPLSVCAPPNDANRVFIAEQGGKIKIVNLPLGTVNAVPFLDLSATVGQGTGTGILGMTFDPGYATNGYFFVSYTTQTGGVFNSGVSHIARFHVSSDPNVADPASEVTIITVDQPQHDHDWDWIGFSNRAGDENNLYICSGDGGNTEDMGPGHVEPGGNGQSNATLLGKILRIHVEADGSYTIPANNPFAGSQAQKQEIFCTGLRNPFRASFDPNSGDLLLGDVGEHDREEVNAQSAQKPGGGENYGWRTLEGSIQNPFYSSDPPPTKAVKPVFDYSHATTGSCVIGGVVYHGKRVRELKNLYFFGDCFGPDTGDFTGRVFTFRYRDGKASGFQDITSQLFPTTIGGYTLGAMTSIGQDARGELYITDLTGNLFQIIESL